MELSHCLLIFRFPAAVDDAVAVWKAVIQSHAPQPCRALWHLCRRRLDPCHGAQGSRNSDSRFPER